MTESEILMPRHSGRPSRHRDVIQRGMWYPGDIERCLSVSALPFWLWASPSRAETARTSTATMKTACYTGSHTLTIRRISLDQRPKTLSKAPPMKCDISVCHLAIGEAHIKSAADMRPCTTVGALPLIWFKFPAFWVVRTDWTAGLLPSVRNASRLLPLRISKMELGLSFTAALTSCEDASFRRFHTLEYCEPADQVQGGFSKPRLSPVSIYKEIDDQVYHFFFGQMRARFPVAQGLQEATAFYVAAYIISRPNMLNSSRCR
ncbi:uncharacterized protein J3D65DRAFT_303958 [Phyllosticta citribraziliensis]|uniref:Uncharacterized protein n=1 Tax=Phyllosticta citribraziliensis TaxID=989973 RepID=A0ABR1LZP5_9PEZI